MESPPKIRHKLYLIYVIFCLVTISTLKQDIRTNEEDKMDKFGFPTNIKQIGNIDDNIRVYIEDTVYAYLMKFSESKEQECIAALVGRCMIIDGKTVLFINGAIQGLYAEMEKGILKFSELSAEHIEEEKEKYFRGLEVVGWLLSQPNYGSFLSTGYINYHKQNFTKPYQVMFVTDPVERLHTFFNWNEDGSDVVESEGFFIYYDRNNEMKAYEEANKIVRFEEINDIQLRLLDNDINYNSEYEEEFDDNEEDFEEDLSEDKKTQEQKVSRAPEPKTIKLTTSETKRVMQTVNKISSDKNKTTNKPKKVEKIEKEKQEKQDKNDASKINYNQQQRVMNMLVMVSSMLFVVSAIMGMSMMKSDSKIEELEKQVTLVTKAYDELVDQFVGDTATVFNQNGTVEVNAMENQAQAPQTSSEQATQSINEMLDSKAETSTESKVETAASSNTTSNNNTTTTSNQTYKIDVGDTLSSISLKFYGTKDRQIDIMRLNGIEDPNKIYFGMKIKLP